MRAGKHVHDRNSHRRQSRGFRAPGAGRSKETGVVAMGGHARRFNPSHQWVHRRIKKGELKSSRWMCRPIFFRRTNMNAPGSRAAGPIICCGTTPATRSICSIIRPARSLGMLCACRARGIPSSDRHGYGHPVESAVGAICTLSLSFNNDGPIGSFFRYICDNGTYQAHYDDLARRQEKPHRSCRAWMSRWTVSSCRTANSSPPSAKTASPTPAWPRCLPCMRTAGQAGEHDRSKAHAD